MRLVIMYAMLAYIVRLLLFCMVRNAGSTFSLDLGTPEQLLETIINARQRLYENNVSDMDNVVLEVSPAIAAVILKAKMNLPFCEADVLESGYLGSLLGCKIYVSNNVLVDYDDIKYNYHNCVMRTTRAVAFAEQFSEIDAYRPEKRFADAVKGLHLYGAKVVYPSEMICLRFGIDRDSL